MRVDELLAALYAEGNYDDIFVIDAEGNEVSGDALAGSRDACLRACQ